MSAAALIQLLRYAHNVPFCEDWTVVPFSQGNVPLSFSWLWSQNNEHRVPLPRLILVALFRMTGDFRAGMFLNLFLIALLAATMIRTASKLRGHAAYTDAFFPLAFLNWGQWENLGWSWQLTFVISTLSVCVLLVLIARQKGTDFSLAKALVIGCCLVSLPLSGGTGLIFVPALATWVAVAAIVQRKARPEGKILTSILGTSVALVLLISIVYFANYQKAYWNPPSPGIGTTLRTAAGFLALSLGPAARLSWYIAGGAVLILSFTSGWLLLTALPRNKSRAEWLRASGMLLFGRRVRLPYVCDRDWKGRTCRNRRYADSLRPAGAADFVLGLFAVGAIRLPISPPPDPTSTLLARPGTPSRKQ